MPHTPPIQPLEKSSLYIRSAWSLVVLIVVGMVGHYLLREEQRYAEFQLHELDALTRQRMLAQQIGRELLVVLHEPGRRSAALVRLAEARKNLGVAMDVLKRGGAEGRFKVLRSEFDGLHHRRSQIADDIMRVEAVAAADWAVMTPEAPLLRRLWDATDQHVAQVNSIVAKVQQGKSESATVMGQSRGWILMLMELGALGVLYVFLFRPVVRHARVSFQRIAQSNEQLARSEARYSALVRGMQDAVVIIQESQIIFVNPAAEAMAGVSAAKLVGSPYVNHLAPYERERMQKMFAGRLAGDTSVLPNFRVELQRSGGDSLPVEVSTTAITYDGRQAELLIMRDISEWEKTQAELDLYRIMIEKSGDPVFLIDDDDGCRMIYVNEAAVRHFGAPKEQILTWRIPDWDPNFTHADLAKHVEDVKKVKNLSIESVHLVQGGQRVPVEITLNAVTYRGRLCHFGYFRNISERKRQEAELREAKQAAEAANRAKSVFLANMSHEIRTPLNAILGFASILSERVTEPKYQQHLTAILSSGKTLLRIINDILDLSKVEAGRLDLEYDAFDLPAMLREMREIFLQKAEEKGVRIEMAIDNGLPRWVVLDEIRLRQVILNLMGNALKFTREGSVSLRAKAGERRRSTMGGGDEADIEIVVEDTGVGIAPDQLEKIFEPFYQQVGHASQYGGTGLGLTISRRLVALMGGDISASSEPGRGSVFRVTLPHVRLGEGALQSAGANPPARVIFDPATILIVDDRQGNRDLIKGFLDEQGSLRFLEAEDGAQGLALARRERPGVIIMDLRMPVLGGREAIAALWEDEELRSIPVIVATASVKSDEAGAFTSNVVGRLNKPMTRAQLVAELIKVVPYRAADGDPAVSGPATQSKEPVWQPRPEQKVALLDQVHRTLVPRWKALSGTLNFDDIGQLAARTGQIADALHCPPLKAWAGGLAIAVGNFDVERIDAAMRAWPALVEKLERAA